MADGSSAAAEAALVGPDADAGAASLTDAGPPAALFAGDDAAPLAGAGAGPLAAPLAGGDAAPLAGAGAGRLTGPEAGTASFADVADPPGSVDPADRLDRAGRLELVDPADPLDPFAYPTLALPLAAFFAVAADPRCTDAAATFDVLGPALSRSAVAGAWPTASATAPPRCWLFLDMSSPDLVNLHAGGHEVPENTDRQ